MEIQATGNRRFLMKLQQRLYNFFVKPLIKLYLKTEPVVSFDGFRIKVFQTVFHPRLFFSTTYFYSFLKAMNLTSKLFLEIGCGSGVISMLAHRKMAIVHCSDINEVAIENTKLNFEQNKFDNKNIPVFYLSDLFDDIPVQQFDFIVINPPFYFKPVGQPAHLAWNCGENGEYFDKLFSTLKTYMHAGTKVYMILAEVCEIDRIKAIANKHSRKMEVEEERKIKWEKSFIFRIT